MEPQRWFRLQSVRKFMVLSILSVLVGCSVVPDPTASGVNLPTASTDSSVIGSWKANSVSGTSSYTHLITFTPKMWYQRWVMDSTPGTSRHPALLEQGSWSWSRSGDTSRLILTPTFRQLATVVANTPDTVTWSLSANVLGWVGPRWNRAPGNDTLSWHMN